MKTINLEPMEEGIIVSLLQQAYVRTESDGRAEVIKGLDEEDTPQSNESILEQLYTLEE